MNVTSVDFSMDAMPLRQSSTASIGRIKPELYKQKSVDAEDEAGESVESCGKLSFSLRYDYDEQALVVKILKALDLPAKDFTGTSDPYVKIYLLPERKKKFQTRVQRKNLNPTFDETFCFPAAYDELCNRKLHFSVYDFDRFTSHDMIGEVVVDNLFELSDLSREAVVWKDIHAATTVSQGNFVERQGLKWGSREEPEIWLHRTRLTFQTGADAGCPVCPPGECGPGRDHVLAVLPAHRGEDDPDGHQMQKPQSHGHHWLLR